MKLPRFHFTYILQSGTLRHERCENMAEENNIFLCKKCGFLQEDIRREPPRYLHGKWGGVELRVAWQHLCSACIDEIEFKITEVLGG